MKQHKLYYWLMVLMVILSSLQLTQDMKNDPTALADLWDMSCELNKRS